MNISKRVAMAAGGALLAAGASIYANSQVAAIPLNTPVNMGSANVCPTGQTTPAPCSKTATVTFKFTSGGSIGMPAVLMLGAPNLDFTDAGTGTCTTNGTAHVYSSNDTCTVDVKFAPVHPGARKGAVVLRNSKGALSASGLIYGTGIGPQAVLSPPIITSLETGGFSGVAVDGSGNVYASVPQAGEVKMIPPGCASPACVTTVFSEHDSFPAALAVDGGGNIYVVSYYGALFRMRPGCASLSTDCILSYVGAGFRGAAGVAVDGRGYTYVARSDPPGAVFQISPGCETWSCMVELGGGFLSPASLAVDGSGNIYVGDLMDSGSVKTMPAGCASSACVTRLGGGFIGIEGVAVDATGNVIVADFLKDALMVIPPGCTSSDCVKTLVTGVQHATGLTLDGGGNIYVIDEAGHSREVKEIRRDSPLTLSFATTNPESTSTDSPQSVTIENDGNRNLNILDVSYGADFPEAAGVNTDCTPSMSLAAGKSCTLSIEFSPLGSSLTGLSTPLSEMVSIKDNNLNGSGVEQSVAVKGTVTARLPAITSPNPGSTLSGSSAIFTWNPEVATTFRFRLGTTLGGNDLYDSGSISQNSVSVTGLPAKGATVYATLSYASNGSWHAIGYTFIEAHPTLLTPAPGSTLSGSSATFTWDPGPETTFRFRLGTTLRGNDIYDSGSTTLTSAAVTTLPTSNGQTVYATLSYKWNGQWYAIGYTFIQAGTPTLPTLLTPAPSSTLTGSSATFTWDPGSETRFGFRLGTARGGKDLYDSGAINQTSVDVTTLPTNGSTVYATLSYQVNGAWHAIGYTYTSQ